MKKLVAIYERKSVLFVSAAHRTQAGFWIDDDRITALREPTSDEVGRAVETALSRSTEGVATPSPMARIDRPLLDAAGVGSWTSFMKLSKHVDVSRDGDALTIMPYRNLGGKGGFEPQPDLALQAQLNASTLGEKVMEALRRAF